MEQANRAREMYGRQTVLFLYEIHRFTKAQQDALLPGVENRQVVLVAATTENPPFPVIAPLLSRSMLVNLVPLTDEEVADVLHGRGGGRRGLDAATGPATMPATTSSGSPLGTPGAALTFLEAAAGVADDRIFEIGARVITAADDPIHASATLPGGHEADAQPDPAEVRDADARGLQANPPARDARRVGRGRPGPHLPQPQRRPARDRRQGGPARRRHRSRDDFVDGLELGEPDDAALRDRRTLSADGLVIVVATVSIEDSEVAADPEITFRGVPMQSGDDSERLLDELADVVEDKLEDALRGRVREPAMIREDVHDAVATFVYKRLKRRPMVLPVVIEV